jgi:hypothetical protein
VTVAENAFIIGEPRPKRVVLLGTLTGAPVPVSVEQVQAPPQALSWLPEVYALVEQGQQESAADIVFKNVDDLLSTAEFRRCDELLQMVDVKRLDINLMMSFLAITLAAKEELPSRAALLRRIDARLHALAPERVEALLRTLR